MCEWVGVVAGNSPLAASPFLPATAAKPQAANGFFAGIDDAIVFAVAPRPDSTFSLPAATLPLPHASALTSLRSVIHTKRATPDTSQPAARIRPAADATTMAAISIP